MARRRRGRRGRRGLDLQRSGGFIGLGTLACLLVLYLGAIPALGWYVAALVVVWIVLFALGVRWFVDRPRTVLLLPVVGVVAFVGAVLLARGSG